MKKLIMPLLLSLLLLVGCSAETEPEHTLEFVTSGMVVMEDGTELFGVFCNYSNLSDETAIPCDEINVTAFQHGVEISVMVYPQDVGEAVQCDTSIQPGTTALVVWTFQLEDESTVSVEFTDGQKFDIEVVEEQ